ncbi:monocarboxylate transporter 4-like [Patiria miniata]|uniref:Major facilitator superfamily (MFS) profile domain-containing protein n=1 Tax=Patiria miniata TaxID=46514 RepID=A0A914BDW5_PATMI|nr:monocarboxylate transporter 4-like [Patiria miniata]
MWVYGGWKCPRIGCIRSVHPVFSRHLWLEGGIAVTCAVTANICAAGVAFRPHLPSRKRTIPADHTDEHSANRQAVTVTFTIARKYSLKCLFYGTVKLFRLNLLRQSYRLSMFCFVQATFILCYGSFIVYIVPFANSSGIEDQRAALLITAFGIGSFIGRPLSGLVNQKVPSLIIFEVAMFASACFVLIALLNTYPYFVISASMFGLAHGFQNTASRVMLREFVGVDNLGSAIGIYSAIGGVADLIGPIVAGSLYDASGTFSVVFYISAVSSFVGFLAMLLAPQLKKIEPGIHTEISVDNV